jgi:hypothetical protein
VVWLPLKAQNPFFLLLLLLFLLLLLLLLFIYLFIYFLAFWGWPDHPLGHGGGSTTPRSAVGVALATPWPKMGCPATPFLAKGVARATPDFLLSFLFSFLIFFFF